MSWLAIHLRVLLILVAAPNVFAAELEEKIDAVVTSAIQAANVPGDELLSQSLRTERLFTFNPTATLRLIRQFLPILACGTP